MILNPVIFLTFANQVNLPNRYLPMLNKEEEELQKCLYRLVHRRLAQVVNLGQIRIENLFHQIVEWDNSHNLTILHYGGHASQNFLEMTNRDGFLKAADATGIAKLLGTQKHLQLVFLNGCSTIGQVDELLGRGVKAVIATNTSVNDQMATNFAIQFYKALSKSFTIQQSFEVASAFLQTSYQYSEAKIISRGFIRDQETEGSDDIYGLYYHEANEDVLNFSFGSPSKKQESLGSIHRYLCDRTDQIDSFHEKFVSSNKNPFFFCAIHGSRRQSHKGLFKRFDYEYLMNEETHTHSKYINLPEKRTLLEYQKGIRINLFREFGLKQLPLKEMNIERLAKAAQDSQHYQVAIHIQVKSSRWKEFTPDLFNWFIHDFCNPKSLKNYRVRFYFFLNIIYEKMKDTRNWLDRLQGKQPTEDAYRYKIQKALEKLDIPQFTYLPELKPVLFSYIDDWMHYIAETDTEKEKWLNQFFPEESEKYDMEDVENRLGQIINKYNQNYLLNS